MNSKYHFSEEELRLAAEKSCSLMLSTIPEYDNPVCFTDDFLNRMDRLIQKIRKKKQQRLMIMRFAAVFVVAMLVVFTWLSVDVQAREKFFRWFKQYDNNYIHYIFNNGNLEKTITDELPNYEISWLPDGFTLSDEESFADAYLAIFENTTNQESLVFEYDILLDENTMGLFSNEIQSERLTINGMEAEIVYGSDASESNNLTWFDESQGIILSINSTLDPETIIRIAEGVRLAQ